MQTQLFRQSEPTRELPLILHAVSGLRSKTLRSFKWWGSKLYFTPASHCLQYGYYLSSAAVVLIKVCELQLRPRFISTQGRRPGNHLCDCWKNSVRRQEVNVPLELHVSYSKVANTEALHTLPSMLCEHELDALEAVQKLEPLLFTPDRHFLSRFTQSSSNGCLQLVHMSIVPALPGAASVEHLRAELLWYAASHNFCGNIAWSASFVGNRCVDSGVHSFCSNWDALSDSFVIQARCSARELTTLAINNSSSTRKRYAASCNDVTIVLYILQADTGLWSYIGVTMISTHKRDTPTPHFTNSYDTRNYLQSSVATACAGSICYLLPHSRNGNLWVLGMPGTRVLQGDLFTLPTIAISDGEELPPGDDVAFFRHTIGQQSYQQLKSLVQLWMQASADSSSLFILSDYGRLLPMLFCYSLEHRLRMLALQLAHCLFSALCRSPIPTVFTDVMNKLCAVSDEVCEDAIAKSKQALQRYLRLRSGADYSSEATTQQATQNMDALIQQYLSEQQQTDAKIQRLYSNVVKSKASTDLVVQCHSNHDKRVVLELLDRARQERTKVRVALANVYQKVLLEVSQGGRVLSSQPPIA